MKRNEKRQQTHGDAEAKSEFPAMCPVPHFVVVHYQPSVNPSVRSSEMKKKINKENKI